MLIFLTILISLAFAILLYRTIVSRKIKKWQQALELNKHQPVFDNLYKNVNGFALSKLARLQQDAIEFIYGEIEFESFIALLALCKPKPNTVFYDLGSGTGKAVIACAMVFDVYKSCGIELFTPLYQCALKKQEQLALLQSYQEKAQKIILKQGNFLNIPILDGTIIFINATTFIAELWEQLSKHIEQVKPDTLVISTSKALVSKRFVIKKTIPAKMSWGIVNVYIQQRLPDLNLS